MLLILLVFIRLLDELTAHGCRDNALLVRAI